MSEAITETQHDGGRSRRLGRGLNALLGAGGGHAPEDGHAPEADTSSNQIHVELIEPNPYQPRKTFDVESLRELSDSIKQHGLLQPLLVRPVDGQYQLIAGERRLIAAKKCGYETVPCIVMELPEQQVFEVAMEENLKRKDLSILEKATGFKEYLEKFGATQEELAKRLSLDRSTLTNMIRLLDLCDEAKDALNAGRINKGQARTILPLDAEQQAALVRRIETEGMTVRHVEEAVRELQNRDKNKYESKKKPKWELTPHLTSLQDQMREKLGVKVDIKLSGENAGQVVLKFANLDEFDRIVNPIKAA